MKQLLFTAIVALFGLIGANAQDRSAYSFKVWFTLFSLILPSSGVKVSLANDISLAVKYKPEQ